MNKLIWIVFVALAVFIGWGQFNRPDESINLTSRNDTNLSIAFDEQKNGAIKLIIGKPY